MTRAYLALAAICIIWGTTYTAIKFAVRDFPPYLLVGIRQTSAGLILLSWAWFRGKLAIPDAAYLRRQVMIGVPTITGGNGFVTWGLQYVSTGLSSVISALTPVFVALISLAWGGAERVNRLMIAGVLLGFAGMGMIFREGWADFLNPDYRFGILGCFASVLSWSFGTVMSKQYNNPVVSPLMNAGLQITAGGLGALVLSVFFDKTHEIRHTYEGWFALIYLTVVGSALAFSLFMYVLKHLSATVSSLYSYINPVVAIFLGWLLLGERVAFWAGIGMLVTIAGVWLVNKGQQKL
jgi:drug/metabolite transporter (DMT)-like permease